MAEGRHLGVEAGRPVAAAENGAAQVVAGQVKQTPILRQGTTPGHDVIELHAGDRTDQGKSVLPSFQTGDDISHIPLSCQET